MNLEKIQSTIDSIHWYHEFDFGNGLKARSKMPDAAYHRQVWSFIERNLDTVDFSDKTVLDIGCWDGYWSFYAERRGARSVLATDDHSQNWSMSEGVFLAKDLLKSSVEVNNKVSVYKLELLDRKFDIIMFLGVYYHLFDPFYALAQIRHCCHPDSVVLIEGVESTALVPATSLYNFSDHGCEWMPTREALEQLIRATYLKIVSVDSDRRAPSRLPGKRWRLRMMQQVLKDSRPGVREVVSQLGAGPARIFINCVPFDGESDLHYYRPPFELHKYDSRFRDE
ncbi:MAG TPA: methyltransferase domain-containing protein [Pyrinomonadaceae bacterium]|jgi:tRNA (mo5U34)-methyltransferase